MTRRPLRAVKAALGDDPAASRVSSSERAWTGRCTDRASRFSSRSADTPSGPIRNSSPYLHAAAGLRGNPLLGREDPLEVQGICSGDVNRFLFYSRLA